MRVKGSSMGLGKLTLTLPPFSAQKLLYSYWSAINQTGSAGEGGAKKGGSTE